MAQVTTSLQLSSIQSRYWECSNSCTLVNNSLQDERVDLLEGEDIGVVPGLEEAGHGDWSAGRLQPVSAVCRQSIGLQLVSVQTTLAQ